MKLIKYFILVLAGIFPACSSLSLKPADFSWPVESVLKVNEDGFVNDERFALSFNTKNMFLEETEDSSSYLNKEIRLIRDTKGFYYLTSDNFKNVYVFNVNDGEFRLENKILISENGISKPAFNQRPPYIVLVEGGNQHNLSDDGIINEEEDEE
jgi:hypothetical protein